MSPAHVSGDVLLSGGNLLGGRAGQVGVGVRLEGTTGETAKWDVGAVLGVASDAAGADLPRRILLQLPPGYDFLFGHPQQI